MRENITPKLRRGLESVCSLPDHVLEWMRPKHMPEYFKAQAGKLSSVLPYERMLELERPVCLLSDGSLGVVWEIDLLPHETLGQAELERRLTSLGEIVEKVRSEKAAFQFIFDSEPHLELLRPENLNGAEPNAPQVFLSERIAEIESYAHSPKHQLRLMRRRAFVTLRFTDTRSFANRLHIPSGENEISAIEIPIQSLSRELMQAVHEVEYSFAHAGMTARCLDGVGLLRFLRSTLHGIDERKCSATISSTDFNFENRISDQVMRGFAELTASSIRVGGDTWEVASWVD
ncbi:hypothetical protein EBR21_06595, partial [bacterium]|nr:hypothetical protein [bacterium]